MTDDAKPIEFKRGVLMWKLIAEHDDNSMLPEQRDATAEDIIAAGYIHLLDAGAECQRMKASALKSATDRIAELEEAAQLVLDQYGFGDFVDVTPPHERNAISVLKGVMVNRDQALRAKPSPAGEKEPTHAGDEWKLATEDDLALVTACINQAIGEPHGPDVDALIDGLSALRRVVKRIAKGGAR